MSLKKTIENEISSNAKHLDNSIVFNVDILNLRNEEFLVISFFWDKISSMIYNDRETFKGELKDYKSILEKEVIPFLKRLEKSAT